MNKDSKLIAEAYNNVSKTENVDIDTLIDAIKQSQTDKGNREFANPFIIGVLSSLVKAALQGESSKVLQHSINKMYEFYSEE